MKIFVEEGVNWASFARTRIHAPSIPDQFCPLPQHCPVPNISKARRHKMSQNATHFLSLCVLRALHGESTSYSLRNTPYFLPPLSQNVRKCQAKSQPLLTPLPLFPLR